MGMDQEPDYEDAPLPEPTPEEESADAWVYWHQRANRFEAALAEIANPIKFMRERAEKNGDRLSVLAYQIANDVGYLQTIARAALTSSQRD